jgi:hypothetical protein
MELYPVLITRTIACISLHRLIRVDCGRSTFISQYFCCDQVWINVHINFRCSKYAPRTMTIKTVPHLLWLLRSDIPDAPDDDPISKNPNVFRFQSFSLLLRPPPPSTLATGARVGESSGIGSGGVLPSYGVHLVLQYAVEHRQYDCLTPRPNSSETTFEPQPSRPTASSTHSRTITAIEFANKTTKLPTYSNNVVRLFTASATYTRQTREEFVCLHFDRSGSSLWLSRKEIFLKLRRLTGRELTGQINPT